jgi:hypothetical protein
MPVMFRRGLQQVIPKLVISLAVICLSSCGKGSMTQEQVQALKDVSDSNLWPGPDDYDAKYNASPDIYDEDEIKVAAYEDIDRYLKTVDFPTVNVFGETVFDDDIFRWRGEVAGEFSPTDRTLETPVMDPAMFTVEYVNHVQQTLLRRYPLWRLHVVGTNLDGEPSLMIYSDAVRVGSTLCPSADLQSELTNWQNQIETIRDRSYGARLRQFLVVKQRLPKLIDKLTEQPVVYVAAFDNWRGEHNCQSFWFLQKDSHDFRPAFPKERGTGDTFDVDSEGRVPLPTNSARSCYLCQWTFPTAEIREIVFREFDFDRTVSRYVVKNDSKAEWRFPIIAEFVLKDADLSRKP